MRDEVAFPVLPELSSIDFSSTADLRALVRERRAHMFGPTGSDDLDGLMDVVDELFTGRDPQFLAADSPYHDVTHTMQATLCLTEMLHNRHFAAATPRIDANDFRRAIVAVLFHDIGYLKYADDSAGTGAKYTHLHEQRSREFVRSQLPRWGWSAADVAVIDALIGATEARSDPRRLDWRSDAHRVLAQAVCASDYIGQISDPGYPDKLEALFGEFEENYRHRRLPESEWPFSSYEVMLRGTPGFLDGFVRHKLEMECEGIAEHLQHPRTGRNVYAESIARNLAIIEQRIASL
jgi:hypothetical protein